MGPDPDQPREYFSFAIHYYVAGRYAVFAGLDRIAGNLLHHAIEMAIEGHLSQTTSSTDLKRYRHSLNLLWQDFKSGISDGSSLDRFDQTVSGLDQFETVRDPEHIQQHGGLASIAPHRRDEKAKRTTKLRAPVPRYSLNLPEIDELLDALLVAASVDPRFFRAAVSKSEAREYLARGNVTRLRDLRS